MNAVVRFLKNWTLPVAITAGALAYFAYSNCPYLLYTKLARKNDIWKSKAKILIDRCF